MFINGKKTGACKIQRMCDAHCMRGDDDHGGRASGEGLGRRRGQRGLTWGGVLLQWTFSTWVKDCWVEEKTFSTYPG